jgi:carboxyl-terminal processing protease
MSPRVRLLIAFVSTSLVGYTLLGALPGHVAGDTTYGQLSVFNEVIRLVDQAYVEPVNMDRALATADMGLTEALDGDSSYLDEAAFKTYQEPLANSADAETGATLTRRFAFLMVVACRVHSPCEKAGLRTGDIIKTIDGKHTRSIPAPVGERMLRGAPGSVVKLAVFRGRTDPVDISVVRERLVPQPVQGRKLEQGPGYVRVPDFDAQTAGEVRSQVDSLKRDGVKSMVLDIRDIATGDMDSAAKVAELFLKGGLVAKLSGRKVTEKSWTADPTKQVWDGPLALLVNTGTSGPAEVLAAALLDSGRAQLVGGRTFGRAGVQKTIPLPQGGLILTVAKYSSPKGTAIHGKGVEPTVAVKGVQPEEDDESTPEDEAQQKPDTDPVLDRAIELLLHPEPVKAAA